MENSHKVNDRKRELEREEVKSRLRKKECVDIRGEQLKVLESEVMYQGGGILLMETVYQYRGRYYKFCSVEKLDTGDIVFLETDEVEPEVLVREVTVYKKVKGG